MMRASSLRTFRLSAARAARGRTEEKRVYDSSPFLPAKVPASRIKPSIRRELNALDDELSEVKMNLVKMQNLEINKMINREIEIHCHTVSKESSREQQQGTIEEMKYFYFWTVENHFFGLLENSSQLKDVDYAKYPLKALDEFDSIQDRVSYLSHNYQYNRTLIKARWNHSEGSSSFFGAYFDNILIRISSIWISQKSGMIFLHFCPTLRISLLLQISIESSQICSVLSEAKSEPNVPSFISKDAHIFLIKVPLSKTSDLKFYARVKSDDIGDRENRDVWRLNPVTSVICDSIHPE